MRWTDVLSCLGLRPAGVAMPAPLDCPLCSGADTLTVYPDPAGEGQWYHCAACREAGDMLELAAAVWKVDTHLAAHRLAAEGVLDFGRGDLDHAARQHADVLTRRRRAVRSFWREASASPLLDGDEAVRILQRMRLPVSPHLGGRARGAARFLGAATRLDLDLAVGGHARGFVKPPPDGDERPRPPVLVLPAFDLPGRIVAFAVFDGTLTETPAVRYVAAGGRRREAGLVFLEAAALSPLSGPAVVMDSALDALRLHDRHLADRDDPLPVVGRLDRGGCKSTCWGSLAPRPVVFWAVRLKTDHLEAARSCGGKVSSDDDTAPLTRAPSFLGRLQPPAWVDRVVAAAVPWDKALDDHLGRMSVEAGDALLVGLKPTAAERGNFVARGLQRLAGRLRALDDRAGRSVVVGVHTYSDCRDGIRCDGVLVCNARLAIRRLIRSGGKLYYAGSVGIGDDEHPFTAPAAAVEQAPADWLRDFCVERGHPFQISLRQGGWLTLVARALYQPEVVAAPDRCGWDADRSSFVFHRFSVGRADHHHCPAVDAAAPTAALTGRQPTAEEWRQAVTVGADQKLLWATAACVLTSVVAPAVCLTGRGTLAVGPAAADAVGLARQIGCAVLPTSWADVDIDDLQAAEAAHGWPVVLTAPGRPKPRVERWLRRGEHNCLLPCRPALAWSVACAAPWNVLEAADADDPGRLYPFAGTVAAGYLKHVYGERLGLGSAGPPLARVLASLADWVRSAGYDPEVVRKAGELLDAAPDSTSVWERQLAAFTRLCRQLKSGLPVERRPDGVFLELAKLQKAVVDDDGVRLDVEPLADVLREAEALRYEEDNQGRVGWVLSAGWWDTCVEAPRLPALLMSRRKR